MAGPMWGRHDHLRTYASAWPGLRQTVGTGGYYLVGTFILEDAATLLAAMQVASGAVSLPVALGALYAGIVLGDLGLYGLGFLSAAHPWARRLVPKRRRELGKDWVSQRVFPLVAGEPLRARASLADLYDARVSARAVRQIRGLGDCGNPGLDHRVYLWSVSSLGC